MLCRALKPEISRNSQWTLSGWYNFPLRQSHSSDAFNPASANKTHASLQTIRRGRRQ